MNEAQLEAVTSYFPTLDADPSHWITKKEDLIGRSYEDEDVSLEVISVYSDKEGGLYIIFSGLQKREDKKIQKLDVSIEVALDGNVYPWMIKAHTPKNPK